MSALPLPHHAAPAPSRRRARLRLVARPATRPAAPPTVTGSPTDVAEGQGSVGSRTAGAAGSPGGLAPTSQPQAWGRRALALLLVLVATTAVVVAAAAAWGAGTATTGAVPAVPVSDVTAVVGPGETIWDVAERHVPAGTSVADYAARIVELNGVDPGALAEWQVLRLP